MAATPIARSATTTGLLIALTAALAGPVGANEAQHAPMAARAVVAVDGDAVVLGSPPASAVRVEVAPTTAWHDAEGAGSPSTQQAGPVGGALVPSEASPGEGSGSSIDVDRDVMVVGSPGADDFLPDAGAATVWRRNDGAWTQEARLAPEFGVDSSGGYGTSVAVAGDVLAVGIPSASGEGRGRVFMYEHNGVEWVGRWIFDSPIGGDTYFGESIALHGDVFVIGAWGTNVTDGSTTYDDAGVVLIFRRFGDTWSGRFVVQETRGTWAGFGRHVDVSGQTAVATADRSLEGTPATTTVVVPVGSFWRYEASLADPSGQGEFGASAVALERDTLAVSDHRAAQVYQRRNGLWEHRAELTSPSAGEGFSWALDVADPFVAVGDPGREAAEIFGYDGSGWVPVASLVGPDRGSFGSAVEMTGAGDGAIGAPDALDTGATYPFAQGDPDGDGVGDMHERLQGTDPDDPDTDADGAGDGADNCPVDANADQTDTDGDGDGDACDDDVDGDRWPNDLDNCPTSPNPSQRDIDRDGQGDVCDDDMDGDGLSNDEEAEHGTRPDDPDTDDDGLTDGQEVLEHESDPLDRDTDGDLFGDRTEVDAGSSPTSPCSVPVAPDDPGCPVDELPITDDLEPVQ